MNKDWEPIFTSQHTFVQNWEFAVRRNQVSACEVERLAKLAQRKNYSKKIKTRGRKYLTDLNNDIEPGWTASGQTQFLLGKIANRERGFHHALVGGNPLEGQALADQIVEVAQALPGYDEFCGHQHEIHKKAKEWARSAEQRYYPYGSTQKLMQSLEELPEIRKLTWNEQQSQEARDRIKQAISDQLEQGTLPAQATARRKALRGYGIGNVTLDKYRSLWHPESLKPLPGEEYHPVAGIADDSKCLKPLLDKEYHPSNTNKLCPDPASAPSVQEADGIVNLAVGGSGGGSTGELVEADSTAVLEPPAPTSDVSLNGPAFVRQILDQIAAKSQQTRRTYSKELLPPDEHYFAGRTRQLKLLDASSSIFSLTDEGSNRSLNDFAVPEHEFNVAVESPSLVAAGLEDVGDVIAEIQVQIQRLAWTPIQAKTWIAEHFAGRSRWQLTDAELVVLLMKLQVVNYKILLPISVAAI